jgi:hypothetical protein
MGLKRNGFHVCCRFLLKLMMLCGLLSVAVGKVGVAGVPQEEEEDKSSPPHSQRRNGGQNFSSSFKRDSECCALLNVCLSASS